MVCELDRYTAENLTPHDYILRITHEMGSQVQLMKQGLQMLLDIFANQTNKELSIDDGTMQELLMKHLDRILMPKSEFLQWYVQKMDALKEIEQKLAVAQGLVVSVPPLNYIGRIVVSYTDDTEKKVIANYGGKSWRRIENFLRGVSEDDPDVGRKLGEDYVELRESNMPVHTHSETLPAGQEPETKSQEWAAKQRSGKTTQPVNTPVRDEDSRQSIDVQNISLNYQISPLEYKNREENEITLPHDNLPPYLKVYIWECTELTKEEKLITGEPDNNLCIVTWLGDNGQDPIEWTREIGTTIENAPVVGKTNYDFKGWKCPDGRIADKKQDGTVGQPVYIGDTVLGNSFYIAQWKPTKHTVTFHGNGGIPDKMTREYDHGQKLGYLPTLDEMKPQATGMVGWFTSAEGGDQVGEDTIVSGNMELWARWTIPSPQYCTVKFYKHDGAEWIEQRRSILKGSLLGSLPTYETTGYDFKGWYTQSSGGTKATKSMRVNNDLNLYAQLQGQICTITWKPNYPGAQDIIWERVYGTTLGSLPAWSRTGYTLNGWWTSETGGSQVVPDKKVEGDTTYYAHWNATEYSIAYDLKGGTAANPTRYTIETPTFSLNNPTRQGWTFLGWTGSNGNTPQLSVSIPKGSTGNKSYMANWNVQTYTVKFDNNGGTGTMGDQIFQYDEFQKLSKNTFMNQVVVQFDGNGGVPETNRLVSFKEFLGWATSPNGSVEYRDEANVKNLTSDSEITLYAKWGAPNKIYLPNAVRTGYSLLGWYTEGGESKGTSGDEYQPTVDITLYANWSTLA